MRAVFLPLLSETILATSSPTTDPIESTDWIRFRWACLSQYRSRCPTIVKGLSESGGCTYWALIDDITGY